MLNSHHLSDDEKAEALKRWWSENGKSIIGGIVIGLALVFGWRGWLDYQVQQSEAASASYDIFLGATGQADKDKAASQLEQLKQDYGSTAYDYFAALDMARLMVQQEDLAAARTHLEFAAANADQPGLQSLANVRLARVLMAMGENEAAGQLVANEKAGAFAGEFAHIRGDLLRAAGDRSAALAEYETALSAGGTNQSLIEMKINQVR